MSVSQADQGINDDRLSIDGSEPCQYPTYISIIPLYATEEKHGVKYDPVNVAP